MVLRFPSTSKHSRARLAHSKPTNIWSWVEMPSPPVGTAGQVFSIKDRCARAIMTKTPISDSTHRCSILSSMIMRASNAVAIGHLMPNDHLRPPRPAIYRVMPNRSLPGAPLPEFAAMPRLMPIHVVPRIAPPDHSSADAQRSVVWRRTDSEIRGHDLVDAHLEDAANTRRRASQPLMPTSPMPGGAPFRIR